MAGLARCFGDTLGADRSFFIQKQWFSAKSDLLYIPVFDAAPLPSNTDTEATAERTKDMPHTLLTLPPELRNQIYSYVLPTKTQEIRFSTSVFPPVPALLQVSQQTREEASGL